MPSEPSPSVQRAPAPGPDTSARVRGGIGAPLSSLPPTARLGSGAPLLGGPPSALTRPDTDRAPASAPAPPTASAAMPVRSAPAVPSGPAEPTGPAPAPATVQRSATATPPPPVRIRPIPRDRTTTAHGPGGTAPTSASTLTPSLQRARTLLPDRPLSITTGSAEGFSGPPVATGGGSSRPVVAATWRRDLAQPGTADAQAGAGQPPVSATAAGTAIQRSATPSPVPPVPPPPHQASGPATRQAQRPGPARHLVVRPHPPAAPRSTDAVPVPVQRQALPVVPDSAGPPAGGPASVGGPASGGPPSPSVRVPPRSPAQSAGAGRPETRAQAVQRAAANAGITGVPVQAAPAKPAAGPAVADTGPADASDAPPANRLSGTEIEELARRLLDPVSRLIRADLRRGRERSGRLHDGRR